MSDYTPSASLSDASELRFESMLSGFNLQVSSTAPDGNCMFSAVTTALIHYIFNSNDDINVNYLQYLNTIGIIPSMTNNQISYHLRQLVNEWLEHRQRYEDSFIDLFNVERNNAESEYRRQAQSFRDLGVFDEAIGDTALSALSNILQLPFVVFSQYENPIVSILPSVETSFNVRPLPIAYYGEFVHYNALLIRPITSNVQSTSTTPTPPLDSSAKSCCCGNGRKYEDKDIRCVPTVTYTTRCPCFRNWRSCSTAFKCNNCRNSFGRANTECSAPVRKISRHVTQEVLRGRFDGLNDVKSSNWDSTNICFVFAVLKSCLDFFGSGRLPSAAVLYKWVQLVKPKP